jgi:alpha,alpha-trehalose-phosphate synthase [UDP-forming]
MDTHPPTPIAATIAPPPPQPPAEELVVVANRLPVTIGDDGTMKRSPGGLVSALSSIGDGHMHWVGWLGNATAEGEDPPAPEGGMHAVPLAQVEIEGYYDGFCNSLLWPLFHGRLQPLELSRTWWRAYRAVNHRFAATVSRIAPTGSTVWVHDYHLLLVPAMLRARRHDVRIGSFLHIPFPPAQLFATLPWRRELLLGMLGADLLGFQTPEDVANLHATVERVINRDLSTRTPRTIVDAFPISVDVDAWERLGESASASAGELRASLGTDPDGPTTVFLGADRLDYTKGIAQRLRAFGELLDEGSLDSRRVRFVQIAVPSRDDIAPYQEERDEVLGVVDEINERHRRADGAGPIHYIGEQLGVDDLARWYRAADCLVVTSLADGMNLVAKEFVACRTDGVGSVVLSEFAGAANDLPGALVINPYDVEAIKRALLHGAAMTRAEQRERMATMRDAVRAHDLDHWAQEYLGRLRSVPSAALPRRRAAAERHDRRGAR